MATVTIFNANPLSVQININNNPTAFTVPAASAPGWIPQSPTTGTPTWSDVGPSQGVLGKGDNSVEITPVGGITANTFTISLVPTFHWNSIQLYIFFDNDTTVSWIVLVDGQYITGNLQIQAA